MSKKAINDLMKEAIDVASDTWARSGVDKAKQMVTVTRYNLIQAFKEAFSKTYQKDFPDSVDPLGNKEEAEKVYRKAASKAIAGLLKHLARKNSNSNLHHKDSNKVMFTQKKGYARTPFRIMKKDGTVYIDKILLERGKKKLNKEQQQSIDRGIQRLHKGTTVGLARLTKVLAIFGDNDEIGSKFITSKIGIAFTEKFGKLLADFELKTDDKGKETISYKGTASILVQRKGKNFPGSDHNDWKKVQELLEKEITKWLKTVNLADREGSKSIREEATETVEFLVMKNLTKSPRVKSRKTLKVPKKTPKRGSATSKAVAAASSKKVAASVARVRAAKRDRTSMVDLLGIISNKINETVAKNMGKQGRLVYRSGDFAKSVEITDIAVTPQGFPSIGYTYQRRPYDTFEPGGAQGSPERDPRKLIDASIREIAMNLAIGRFYTRRV